MVRFPLGKWLCSAEIWLYKEIDDINWERGKGNQLATSVQREGNYSFEAVKVAWFRIYSEEWADRSLLNWMMLSKKTSKTGFSPKQLVRGDCHLLRCKRVWEELLLNSGWRQEEEERSWFFEKSLLSEVGHVSECGPYVCDAFSVWQAPLSLAQASVMAGFHIMVSSHPPKPSVPSRVPTVGHLSVPQILKDAFILSFIDLLTCLSMYMYWAQCVRYLWGYLGDKKKYILQGLPVYWTDKQIDNSNMTITRAQWKGTLSVRWTWD